MKRYDLIALLELYIKYYIDAAEDCTVTPPYWYKAEDVAELVKRSRKLIEDALWGKWTQIDINKAEKHIAEIEQIVRENEHSKTDSKK